MKRVLLVRHGQSRWNAEQRWQGHADPPLSELGERQARHAAAAVAVFAPSMVVTSDLERARGTGERLAPGGLIVLADASWRERDAGAWTGLLRSEIDERYPGWIEDHRRPPGFEGDAALMERIGPALHRLGTELHEGGVAIVVTHGGVIRALEHHLGATPSPVPNLGARWLVAASARREGSEGWVLGARELLIDPDEITMTASPQL